MSLIDQMQSIPLAAVVKDLEQLLPQLAPHDREFASSLINGPYGYKKRGYLTPAQQPHAYRLFIKAMGVSDPETESESLQLGGIFQMFEIAKQHLKYPKVQFDFSFGPLKLWIQGYKAKIPGALGITLHGEWVGRVKPDGELEQGKWFKNYCKERQAVIEFLQKLAQDPATTAAEYGKLTSNCCFCHSALTDPKSLAVGYGPICAKHYGLSWGKTTVVMLPKDTWASSEQVVGEHV